MRQIEKEMLHAVRERRNWSKANTRVDTYAKLALVKLHGHTIATVSYAEDKPDRVGVHIATLRRWPTPTTKSRLRALGVPVRTKAFSTYLGDTEIWDDGAEDPLFYDVKELGIC